MVTSLTPKRRSFVTHGTQKREEGIRRKLNEKRREIRKEKRRKAKKKKEKRKS